MPNIIGNVLNELLSDISINFFNNHKYYLTQDMSKTRKMKNTCKIKYTNILRKSKMGISIFKVDEESEIRSFEVHMSKILS